MNKNGMKYVVLFWSESKKQFSMSCIPATAAVWTSRGIRNLHMYRKTWILGDCLV